MQQTSLNGLTMTCDDLREWGQRTKSLHTFANYEKSDTRSRTCKHSASALRLREVRHLQSSPETHETQVRRNARAQPNSHDLGRYVGSGVNHTGRI